MLDIALLFNGVSGISIWLRFYNSFQKAEGIQGKLHREEIQMFLKIKYETYVANFINEL